jgi:hypothetical protein
MDDLIFYIDAESILHTAFFMVECESIWKIPVASGNYLEYCSLNE